MGEMLHAAAIITTKKTLIAQTQNYNNIT